MKKFIEKIGIETALAGLFGAIAIIAAFFEMAIAHFDSASIAGGVKDIAGTVIAVVMLIVAIKALRPKKKTVGGFEAKFDEEMEKVISKYSPLIEKDTTTSGRYNIADNMAVLYQNINCKYHRLLDFNYEKNEISFSVSKTLFMGKSQNDFSEQQTIIINSITSKITNDYEILNKKYSPTKDGFKLTFSKELVTQEDAIKVAEVIDKIILLYIVENKK